MTKQNGNTTRRGFLLTLWAGAWAALVTSVSIALATVLRFAGAGQEAQAATPQVDMAGADKLKVGGVIEKGRVAVVRDAGGLYGLDLTCPHLGCLTSWDATSGHFVCPCHGSVFARDGARLAGPATRGLRYVTLERISGKVVALPGSTAKPKDRLKPKGSA